MDSIDEKGVFICWTMAWDEEFVMKGCDNEICDSYVEIYLMESSSINCNAIILEEHSFKGNKRQI